ncbi:hypothetical protein NJB1907f44_11420 [Mycobacterium marinum]|nr:hypothetical protein NJB1907f34b_16870 [Mycobacterium marinum]GJO05463.1 hypothetical protein NJB1808e29_33150 [Mycobacterium marinum]GJO12766.1 hypothetical protein NJB1907E90_35360 [Mycobacterium marinum]GJO21565.1 hypothetical protein NJB1907E11_30640 [Mycobacterium marinum]GJO30655.1 hypothetical protein NJB1728e18_46340 [Mycobacterium marinum]
MAHDNHRCTFAQRRAHPGNQPAPAVHGDEQRVARLPAAVCGPPARIAGDPELDELLIADLPALRVIDDVTDHGKRRFKHLRYSLRWVAVVGCFVPPAGGSARCWLLFTYTAPTAARGGRGPSNPPVGKDVTVDRSPERGATAADLKPTVTRI